MPQAEKNNLINKTTYFCQLRRNEVVNSNCVRIDIPISSNFFSINKASLSDFIKIYRFTKLVF